MVCWLLHFWFSFWPMGTLEGSILVPVTTVIHLEKTNGAPGFWHQPEPVLDVSVISGVTGRYRISLCLSPFQADDNEKVSIITNASWELDFLFSSQKITLLITLPGGKITRNLWKHCQTSSHQWSSHYKALIQTEGMNSRTPHPPSPVTKEAENSNRKWVAEAGAKVKP